MAMKSGCFDQQSLHLQFHCWQEDQKDGGREVLIKILLILPCTIEINRYVMSENGCRMLLIFHLDTKKAGFYEIFCLSLHYSDEFIFFRRTIENKG